MCVANIVNRRNRTLTRSVENSMELRKVVMKIRKLHTLVALCAAAGLGFADTASAQEGVKEDFMASGLTRLQGGYRPVRAEMDQEADIVTKTPEDLVDPKFGFLESGDQKWAFLVDTNEDGEQKLYVDTNGDGDLTNDPETEWSARESGEYTMYNGSAKVELGPDKLGVMNMYRFDPSDERRAVLKNTLLYYSDFGTKLTITMDGKDFETAVGGVVSEGDSMTLDRNGDGKKSRRFESLVIGEPFNFTGTTYVLNPSEDGLKIVKAEEELPLAPMPPDLKIGKMALEFSATTMAGDEIEFPSSYKGKVVMLDFWATWCGPCVREIPNMKVAYKQWHDKGFEILGVSFDQADMEEKIEKFRESREMPWPQIYEGKYWDTSLGHQHDVSGIPFVLLVDGDSGEILGTSRELRGPGLTKFVGEQLLKKGMVTEEQLAELEESDEEGEEDK